MARMARMARLYDSHGSHGSLARTLSKLKKISNFQGTLSFIDHNKWDISHINLIYRTWL